MKIHEINGELDKIKGLIHNLEVQFVDESIFRGFINSILTPPQHGYMYFPGFWSWKNTLISGYFDESIFEPINTIAERVQTLENSNIKLLTHELNLNKSRDKKNFDTLKKLNENKIIECRINVRNHSRFLLQYNELKSMHKGYLIIGTFDFNKEGVGGTRRDSGIFTRNSEILKQTKEYFFKCWENTHDSHPINEYPPK